MLNITLVRRTSTRVHPFVVNEFECLRDCKKSSLTFIVPSGYVIFQQQGDTVHWPSFAFALTFSIKLGGLSQSTWVRFDNRVEGSTLEVDLFDPDQVSLLYK